MEIRTYHASDREALVDLWTRCSLVRPSNDAARDIERKLRHSPDLLFVGVIDEVVVASIMVGYDGHRGWLNYLAVRPDLRRRGFAARLLAYAEGDLASRGCAKVNLQVRATNVDAVAFYEHVGYGCDDVVSFGKRLEFDD